MDVADQPLDGDGLSCPERDAIVASLLGITPERLRTMRRVHRKRADGPSPGGTRWWQRIDQLGDDELFATFRQRELRARRLSRPPARRPRSTSR